MEIHFLYKYSRVRLKKQINSYSNKILFQKAILVRFAIFLSASICRCAINGGLLFGRELLLAGFNYGGGLVMYISSA